MSLSLLLVIIMGGRVNYWVGLDFVRQGVFILLIKYQQLGGVAILNTPSHVLGVKSIFEIKHTALALSNFS